MYSLIHDLELSGLVALRITDKILKCEDGEKIEKILDVSFVYCMFKLCPEVLGLLG